MQYVLTIITGLLLLLPLPSCLPGEAGTEWDILNQEVTELYRTGRYGRAVVVAKKALEVAEKSIGPNPPTVAQSLNNLALLYRTQGHYALAIWEKALGPDHPDVATSLNNLAVLYRATERDTEAAVLEQRAARIEAIQR